MAVTTTAVLMDIFQINLGYPQILGFLSLLAPAETFAGKWHWLFGLHALQVNQSAVKTSRFAQ